MPGHGLLHRLIGVHLRAACIATALMASVTAHADDAWPQKPIQLIVPFPAGSSPDVLARTLSEQMAKDLGQAIVVDNKPGAGGNIGTRYAAKAKPDGYTVLLTINGPIVTAPALYKNTLGYDPLTDLTPISLIGKSPNVLVVPANSPAGTLQEFISQAKEKPGELNYGTVGPGSSSHLGIAMLEQEAGIQLQQIPYSGFPQVVTALIAGDIHAGLMVPGLAMPQVQAGKLRALAISSAEPSDLLSGVPTMVEQGFPGFEVISWDALFVPAGTPAAIAERLNASVTRTLRLPEVQQKLAALYFSSEPSTPAEMSELIVSEKTRLEAVIERLNLSLE
jgi:tripartite-type tricarboxylate transporter receptor subunit TctC